MKPNLRRYLGPWLWAACIQLAFLGLPHVGSSQTTVCTDPANVIYGLTSDGKIYPVTVSNATAGTVLNSTVGTVSSPNALGYCSITGKFYYYLQNPNSGTSGMFVAYDPVTNTYDNLSEVDGPTEFVYRASVTADGKYYCIDRNSNLYCYTISTNTWKYITSSFIDQFGNDVDALFRSMTSGDMAFDGYGNLWFVVSGGNKIGLYKLQAPISSNTVSSLTITQVLTPTTASPDGTNAVGIAFNQTGLIFISTSNNNLYRLESNFSFTFLGDMTLKGHLPPSFSDLTSCNFPMSVMPLKWVSFSATSKDKNQVNLNWQVASQVNNKGFYVQYSRDQSSWQDVAYIPSRIVNGIGIEQYTYSYIANLSATNFFRIKQEDLDGHFSYSWIKVLNMSGDGAMSIYPNPVRDRVNILNNSNSNSSVQIRDMSGRVIQSMTIRPGEQTLDVSSFKNGIYLISFEQSDGTKGVMKMVKQ